ncbi:hypothetical protein L218DRAFT_967520, partial [Marasmius fiardii PR-910]
MSAITMFRMMQIKLNDGFASPWLAVPVSHKPELWAENPCNRQQSSSCVGLSWLIMRQSFLRAVEVDLMLEC